jgi:hypothetical protein
MSDQTHRTDIISINIPDRDYFLPKKVKKTQKKPKTAVFYRQSVCGLPAIYAL